MVLENHEEKDRRVNADWWKNINGAIAIVGPIVLPVITGLAQYYITKNSNSCNCDGSST